MNVERDVQAIARASNFEQHGTTFMGGMFATCICPRTACGGVASDTERYDCPHHRKEPAQLWHWAAECPSLEENPS
jgi:hypothetical protein